MHKVIKNNIYEVIRTGTDKMSGNVFFTMNCWGIIIRLNETYFYDV